MELEESEKQLYSEKGYTEAFVAEWLAKFSNDEKVNYYLDKIESMEEKVFDA